jgi:hypothetical protein
MYGRFLYYASSSMRQYGYSFSDVINLDSLHNACTTSIGEKLKAYNIVVIDGNRCERVSGFAMVPSETLDSWTGMT